MATAIGKDQCIICHKEKRTVRCEGCSQMFCFNHINDHRQELSGQLNEIEMNRDVFRQTLTERRNDPEKHSLIKQIDQWEEDSIKQIQQTAQDCRQILIQHTTEHINQTETNLVELTDQLKEIRQENDFNEIDLSQLKQRLAQLAEEFDKPPNMSIQQGSGSLINKISVIVFSRKFVYLSIKKIEFL
jgi:seryl-tRNA synthetase